MIDIPDTDIVHRLDVDGRFLLFTNTDLPPGHPLTWWGVTFDTGGDGHGLLLVPGPTDLDAWTGLTLLEVLLLRTEAELNRRLGPLAANLHTSLRRAIRLETERLGKSAPPPPKLCPGGEGPYGWTIARRGPHLLPLCPDPESRAEGITPLQLLFALAQLYDDATNANLPIDPTIPHLLADAIEAEQLRLKIVRNIQPITSS